MQSLQKICGIWISFAGAQENSGNFPFKYNYPIVKILVCSC